MYSTTENQPSRFPSPADLPESKGWVTMSKTDYSSNTEEPLLIESLIEPKHLWEKSFLNTRAFLDFEIQ